MYHIHHTLGVIIQSLPLGEANRVYFVFTGHLGMVRVHAQGVRLSKSKLRSHLVPFTIKEFSLVRGKEIWRLTSVKDAPEICKVSELPAQKVAAKVLSILGRLVHGEEAHEKLFTIIAHFLHYLAAVSSDTSANKFEEIELITVFRLLHELGYINKTKEVEVLLADTTFSDELLSYVRAERSRITVAINNALKESQL